ncbi:MAG: HPr family phosphocarrier protein [Simkaniaceae bacterium]|nr:HPr family phosphocarrier protein [Candidatus Sacchlamyda saccharinae]
MRKVKKTCQVKVKNTLGLHARPATVIVKLLQKVKSDVTFSYRGATVNAKSIMSILMLAVGKNGLIEIAVEGEDALDTMEALIAAFDNEFGEKSIEAKT